MTRRTIPGQNPGKPTAEAVADALIQYETGGICHYGQTCGLCDCGKADETPEQTQTRDAMELDRARAVLALIPPQRCAPSEDEVAAEIRLAFRSAYEVGTPDPTRVAVRAIAKLYGDQPTVAQAKALPVIVAAVLKPIRELHVGREHGALAGYCRNCGYAEPCPTARLCDEIEAAAKGGE